MYEQNRSRKVLKMQGSASARTTERKANLNNWGKRELLEYVVEGIRCRFNIDDLPYYEDGLYGLSDNEKARVDWRKGKD